MTKVVIVTCDGCQKEPDPNKNFLMVNGMIVKFGPNGPQKVVLDQHFCDVCADKILTTIEKMNEPAGSTNS